MFLFSTHSQGSRGRLPLLAGERFDGEYRLLTGEDSDTMQQLGACLLLQPFATRNLKTSYPHISDTRGLMLLYCASSARISYMKVAKILTSVDAVLREGITQKRPIPADIPINIPRSYSHPSQMLIRFTYWPPRKGALCSQLRPGRSHASGILQHARMGTWLIIDFIFLTPCLAIFTQGVDCQLSRET